MSRGEEELLIGREAARIVLILHQIQCEQNFQLAAKKANHTLKHPFLHPRNAEFYSCHLKMASPQTISPPVRVLLRTNPTLLDFYSFDTNIADTKLIRDFSKLKSHDMKEDTNIKQHLLTRVARRVWIIFDYGVAAEDGEPSVIAFDIRSNESSLIIQKLQYPGLQKRVNETVKASRAVNADLPSRTDLRKNKTSRENARYANS